MKLRSFVLLIAALAPLSLSAGCELIVDFDRNLIDSGQTSDTGVADSGHDAGRDSGMDAGEDSGTDAGEDSGTDAGEDSGTDSGMDATIVFPDSGMDATTDDDSGV